MTLSDYLSEARLNYAEFGRKIGVSRQAVRRYVEDGRIPESAVLKKIIWATDGKVTANDFFARAA